MLILAGACFGCTVFIWGGQGETLKAGWSPASCEVVDGEVMERRSSEDRELRYL